ncbi:MAG: TonB-dependent receptor, partial [Elusimicrobia bacterium]|nr:TonB-dependent receptor [Elusimicrobiota bacterium]
FGYLNAKHKHADDFTDRPIAYRAFLGGGFADDGAQMSILLPTRFFSEIGGGAFRGSGFPATDDGNNPGLISAFARVGGDIGRSHAWRLGGSFIHARNTDGREDDDLIFTGSSDIFGIDFRYVFSPRGNNRNSEFAFTAEYLFRNERNGIYYNEDNSATANGALTSGFHVQAVYRFMQRYRIGYRFAWLNPASTPAGFEDSALDADGHRPHMHSIMAEFNTSEFGRFRAQFNHDRTSSRADNQFILQYIITFGAHGAHGF